MDNLLELRDLQVRYGPIEAVKKVSMTVKKGQIVALLGANGAGKSTIIKTIAGVVQPSSGVMIYNGNSINKLKVYQLASEGIICSPEGRMILRGLTVEENLRVGAYGLKPLKVETVDADGQKTEKKIAVRQRIKENLERVYGYFPVLKERRKQQANTLSGGEQQMLAIGRALMASPKLLLLDEPSLGLAPLIVRDIFAIIKQISEEGTTILIVEQNAYQTLKIADYAYVLELGKIRAEGTSEELLKDETLTSAYLGGK